MFRISKNENGEKVSALKWPRQFKVVYGIVEFVTSSFTVTAPITSVQFIINTAIQTSHIELYKGKVREKAGIWEFTETREGGEGGSISLRLW